MTTTYYKLSPGEIVNDINKSQETKSVRIKGAEFLVFPHVYPSDKFRSTNFILDALEPYFNNATLCDMGCGMGVIGLFAIQNGAKEVVQIDVNPLAIENAKANRDLLHYSDEQVKIIESNCFDHVPHQAFDIIVFNIPFHSEPYTISDPLEYAFHDPEFVSTQKFLNQVIEYCHPGTKIFIAFSNKGDIKSLENIFDMSGINWELWVRKNIDQEYDNRLYCLSIK